jgi:hypothetical protein
MSQRTVTLTIGLTDWDTPAGHGDVHIPAVHGWRPGLPQVEHTLTVTTGEDDLAVCEAVFTATNAPEEIPVSQLAQDLRTLLTPHRQQWMRALCVGDTVTVNGTRYACATFGFEPAPDPT